MADEHYPAELRYHREHDWVRVEGDEAVFGITWFAQDALGEVVFFEPPAVGAQLTADATYGELESVKAVSDIYAPADGEVIAVNDDGRVFSRLVNSDPYGAGWLVRVRLTNPAGLDDLMDQAGVYGLPGGA